MASSRPPLTDIPEPADGAPQEFYGVVPSGKPLARAVWTASLELAEDMYCNHPDGPRELWRATLVERTKT
ncbi:MAG: hypothetical protein ABW136_02315 [Steroidobacteraceae bacterium]